MDIVNMHDAKTQLSRLVEAAANGVPFVIAATGKPMVRVTSIDAPPAPRRIGFLQGEILVPKDFNAMGAEQIAALFGVEP
jgi:antitoxin (DNA-binding transcriptional repressor) of toxin-antitoxin stability system